MTEPITLWRKDSTDDVEQIFSQFATDQTRKKLKEGWNWIAEEGDLNGFYAIKFAQKPGERLVSYSPADQNVFVVLFFGRTHKQYETFLASLKGNNIKQLGYLKAYAFHVARELRNAKGANNFINNSTNIINKPVTTEMDNDVFKYAPQGGEDSSFGL